MIRRPFLILVSCLVSYCLGAQEMKTEMNSSVITEKTLHADFIVCAFESESPSTIVFSSANLSGAQCSLITSIATVLAK